MQVNVKKIHTADALYGQEAEVGAGCKSRHLDALKVYK
jgi:hypothetical protein